MHPEAVLCPSARCEVGAILLGIALPGGRVAFASDRIVVDEAFVHAAQEGRSPEQRFRFSAPCVKGACRQWTGTRCGVIDQVLDCAGSEAAPVEEPACSIRPQCRWYLQSGAAACAVCPLVVTDVREPTESLLEHGAIDFDPEEVAPV
jgi:hypothetical protein